jgi:UDP-N-acetylmuramyl tripeptide synthase
VAVPPRTRLAAGLGNLVAGTSRRVGAGEGSVIGGRVTLALDPGALAALAAGRRTALVTGTNGKTTTTRLLAAAMSTLGPVSYNRAGANLLAGLVTALASGPPGSTGVLEVDEGLLPAAVRALSPASVTLLNLSRDQLDRIGEVRLHAESWRRALSGGKLADVVANADDPLVTWAAQTAERVTWVGTGLRWRADAAACPACGEAVSWSSGAVSGSGSPEEHWSCTSCSLERPRPHLWLEDAAVVVDGTMRLPVELRLPGAVNRANATMALATSRALGADPEAALAAMTEVRSVAGRYDVLDVDGTAVRMLLAKNPAGWAEALGLLRPPPIPVVVGINARIADGRDPSWLWDVPFERLAGRPVVATGDRGRDLAVRLRYAEVEHTYASSYREAVRLAGGPEVDLAANYTAFQDARKELRG